MNIPVLVTQFCSNLMLHTQFFHYLSAPFQQILSSVFSWLIFSFRKK
ncbi:hypothetical protein OIU78_028255 [Salix suchowensis]|nr:hypothetical protein OIU78_028255 [Salix suchowensis]